MKGIAGISGAERLGLGVNEACAILRRFEYVERRLTRMLAGWLPKMPVWEAKQAFGRHLWEDAEHTAALRKRIVEMRMGPRSFDAFTDPTLELLLDEAVHAETPAAFIDGTYLTIKAALVDAYRWYLDTSNPLVDFPSLRVLKQVLAEEEEQLAWAREAYAELATGDNRCDLEDWQNYLSSIIKAAGGIAGRQPASGDLPEARHAGQVYRIPREPGRDSRFEISSEGNYSIGKADAPSEDSGENREKIVIMMRGRMNEMQAAECVAATIWEVDGKSWPFYHDLARHCWDEIRHSAFGEVALGTLGHEKTEFPVRVGSGRVYLGTSPVERYTMLGIGAEHGMMKSRYKQFEMEFCRATGYELETQYQDFDWADEALHVAIARRWVLELLDGDASKIPQVLSDAAAQRARILAEYATPTEQPEPEPAEDSITE